jgi:hypothetical protein
VIVGYVKGDSRLCGVYGRVRGEGNSIYLREASDVVIPACLSTFSVFSPSRLPFMYNFVLASLPNTTDADQRKLGNFIHVSWAPCHDSLYWEKHRFLGDFKIRTALFVSFTS